MAKISKTNNKKTNTKVKKTISSDANLTGVLQERFKIWKKFYVK